MSWLPYMIKLLNARRFEDHRQAIQAMDEQRASKTLYPPRDLDVRAAPQTAPKKP